MLEQLIEQVMDSKSNTLQVDVQLHRMDGNPGMRKRANLGTCDRCDFLAIGDYTKLFIEENELLLYTNDI